MASPIFFIDRERPIDCALKHRMAIIFAVRRKFCGDDSHGRGRAKVTTPRSGATS
jgi:hypothetical protein